MDPYVYVAISNFVLIIVAGLYSKSMGRSYSDIAAVQIIAAIFMLLLAVLVFAPAGTVK